MLPWLLDAAYLVFLLAVSPWLVYRRFVQKKPIAGLRAKLTGNLSRPHRDRPCIWFHAVSVGEVLQLQAVLGRMQALYAGYEFVVTTTTGTGYDVARSKYPNCTVRFFPLDFSWAVRRAIVSLKPKLIVLVELELWPNFLLAAKRFDVPVAIINGRISDHSIRSYRRFAWLTRPMLEMCSLVTVQSQTHAERFLDLGAPPARVFQTGNIKFDGVEAQRENPKTAELRRHFGIGEGELVFLAGSTQAPEEEYALTTWESLRSEFPALRLLLVPRHKERFEEVAELVVSRGHGIVRRSQGPVSRESRNESLDPEKGHTVHRTPYATRSSVPQPSTLDSQPVLLLDTLGELSRAWGLADIAFVGGSLTQRGGQNMIEPAAYGAAVLFGPNTWNFRDITEALLARGAALVVHDAAELTATVRRLASDASVRARLGATARQFVLSQQGATDRTIDLLGRLLGVTSSKLRSDRAA
jgi:3-deoxy-D-manno-octulosonic-acid transferase